MNRKIIPIKGMHCRSCEILVEDELSKIPGVTGVEVNQKKGEAIVFCSNTGVDEGIIEQAVVNAGYLLGYDTKKPWFSTNINDYIVLATCGIILTILFFVANDLGVFKLVSATSNNYASLPIVFLVGITAGLSTCMALVGGLVLGISARHAAQHPEASARQKFRPHLFFNLGQVTGYAVLGGVLGSIGSVLQLSSTALGWMTIGVGMVMLLMGGKLIGIFPRLEEVNFTMPSSIARLLGLQNREKEYSHRGADTLGA